MSTSPNVDCVRAFAILPAAGESLRMGEDKLLLDWRGQTIIEAVIDVWRQTGVEAIVAVAHPRNEALISRLRDCRIHLVVPQDPPKEMKHSVQLALEAIESQFQPCQRDIWLLAPADMPRLSSKVARRVIELAGTSQDEIIVPVHNGRRGHPAAFRWSLAKQVASLARQEGINAILRRHPVKELELGQGAIPGDIDTPQDYQRSLREGS